MLDSWTLQPADSHRAYRKKAKIFAKTRALLDFMNHWLAPLRDSEPIPNTE